jgi:preprotein translocase subunit SecF
MVTRTILTSTATAMSLLPLLIFGGPNLFDFSAPILFGIVVGTFSSIYVAAALLLYLPAPAGKVETAAEATG